MINMRKGMLIIPYRHKKNVLQDYPQ